MNRNHLVTLGVVMILVGCVLNRIENFTLNETATRVLAEQAEHPAAMMPQGTLPPKTITPPAWLRFALISLGFVAIAYAAAMNAPEKH
jgi:hypothetical protein